MAKNLLFVTADQWRGECLSTLGHFVRTPNLGALATEGTLFKQHFVNSIPCGPSRASLHTGTLLETHGVRHNSMPLAEGITDWATELRRAGLNPVMFGYSDIGGNDDNPAGLPGLDTVIELGKDVWHPTAWAKWLETKGYDVPENIGELYSMRSRPDGRSKNGPLQVPADLHDTAFMVDSVIEYVDSSPEFCIHLALLRPHPPWVAPSPYHEMYIDSDLPIPETSQSLSELSDLHPFLGYLLDSKAYRATSDSERLARWAGSYYGLMTEVDHQLGRLFAALRHNGQWDDTLVIFTSDHGEQLGEFGLIGKVGFFDASFHVPLIIKEATRDRGAPEIVDSLTEAIDLVPTILDAFDLDIPEQCVGESLLPFVRGESQPARSETKWQVCLRGENIATTLNQPADECCYEVVRTNQQKLVRFENLPDIEIDLNQYRGELIRSTGI